MSNKAFEELVSKFPEDKKQMSKAENIKAQLALANLILENDDKGAPTLGHGYVSEAAEHLSELIIAAQDQIFYCHCGAVCTMRCVDCGEEFKTTAEAIAIEKS